ncbi:MAG: GNAT family protein [Saprospiraceae bacterium]
MHLKVRDLELSDIPLLLDYWYNNTDDHLVGMGVDLKKMPPRKAFENMLEIQLSIPIILRQSYVLIWMLDEKPVGHSNINQIEYGHHANLHLHIWEKELRKSGLGRQFVEMSLPKFFEAMDLEYIICEPYAHNPAPNKTLEKLGFTFIKKYTTIPGSINFEQEVNQWRRGKG